MPCMAPKDPPRKSTVDDDPTLITFSQLKWREKHINNYPKYNHIKSTSIETNSDRNLKTHDKSDR